jgi:diguanylate cyclase (GGDEF)-like protein
LTKEQGVLVSAGTASRREYRVAIAAVMVSGVIFCVAVPFAAVPLKPVPAFIPAYESALVLSDLITAALLFGQFNILRTRAVFMLACGYLFTALVAVVHELSFPAVFSSAGLFGGLQTTIWLYVSWHSGFPLCVILYALFKRRVSKQIAGAAPRSGGLVILGGVAATFAVAAGLALAIIANQDDLPALIHGIIFTPLMTIAITGICALCVGALIGLWRQTPRTALDLWLMVVMFVWLFDTSLCGIFNAGRFDLGWYAGRIYGLLAANSLLMILLAESASHYRKLAQLSDELGAANQTLEKLSLVDGLTSIANRRHFDSHLAGQLALARRHKRALALVLCDVDSFKAFNDSYGHQAGDECLKKIASVLLACCRRPGDLAARYGGEEFAMILPDTGPAAAGRIAEDARAAVAELGMLHAHSRAALHVSISGGVAVLHGEYGNASVEQLIHQADQALYRAKREGRNRMIRAHAEAEPLYALHP